VSIFESLSEPQLIAIVNTTKDGKAYSELVSRHQNNLFSFVYRYTNDFHLAQDVTQETLIKAFEKLHLFKGDASFKTWLFSIAYREFLLASRKQNAFSRLLEKFELTKRIAVRSDNQVAKDDNSIDIQIALNFLSEEQKATVLLCDLIGMTNLEASRILQIPLGSVKTYIKQGRQLMQESLTVLPENTNE
jgi:RNA polymerase sigma-70 factor (ECF subfamily)